MGYTAREVFEFYQKLIRADWSYEYSDDQNAYYKGKAQIEALRLEAIRSSKLHVEEFNKVALLMGFTTIGEGV